MSHPIDDLTLRMLAAQHPTTALRTALKFNHSSLRSEGATRCAACALALYGRFPPHLEDIEFYFREDHERIRIAGWCNDCKVRLTSMEALCPVPPSTP